ncbi:hypothetical protein EDD15DRAFT_2364627 [Pisolithus albus]|nr:hypothetical protein EDD15DRAFT_2364627 [Pisolithus albus]
MLNLNKFSVPKLQTEEGQYDAFEHLNDALAVGHIEDVVRDLLSKPALLVYILSVFPNAKSMRTKILDAFPTDPLTLQQSFIPSLLSKTSAFFFNLPSHAFQGDESRTVGRYKRYVTDVWPAVGILSSIAAGTKLSGNTNHKEKKTVVLNHDATILRKLNIQSSLDSDIAMESLGDVMAILLQILEFYLDLLSDPRFVGHCEEVFFDHSGQQDDEGEAEAADGLPPAYTQVPYLGATLATTDINRFGEWPILMSASATKHLSSGDEMMRKLPNYQIDRTLDDDGQAEREAVKVYGIYSHEQLGHIWPWLSTLLNGRGEADRQRCTLAGSGSAVYNSAVLPPTPEEFTTDESPILPMRTDHMRFVKDRYLCLLLRCPSQDFSCLMSNKYFKLSTAYLNGLIAEQKLELPLQLTFVVVSSVCLPLLNASTGQKNGRSYNAQILAMSLEGVVPGMSPVFEYSFGSRSSSIRKTTAMVYKMLGIQRTWEQLSDSRKPRQLFVTRFPVLAAKVEEFFSGLVESLALAGCTQAELRNLRSQNRDAKSKEPQMADPLNALNYRVGTPQKYSDLGDHDFQLFITFDQLARMIAADSHVDDPNCYDRHNFILGEVINDESSFITYEIFTANYWPRLRSALAQHYGPWLVFSEFMGVIKGSEQAFRSPTGILDRQTYTNLSARTFPVFAEDRHSLYSAFESYSKLKRERGGYDMADRTYAILKALSRNPLKGLPVDRLYVDEVQDNLIIDIMLLRILCNNADGLFWAGDTAQTISAGSSFRFADLKSFIYRIEAERSLGVKGRCKKPELFELAINYRSHGGIVNCAQSVVELITDFWPESIDPLETEQAMMGGPKPVFFAESEDGSLLYEPFFSGLGGSRELGAEQCIIVRDSVVRRKIRERFGDIAVILYDLLRTLEAYGNKQRLGLCKKARDWSLRVSVFLYNFFEDSAAPLSQWRVLSTAFNNRETASSLGVSGSPHSVLCTELKNLYVGITRAQKKLYILDQSQKSEPMRELWSSEGLIEVAPPTDICRYIGKSSPKQWAASGYKLFNAGQFQEAIRCFERADLPRQVRIAKAYQLRQVATSTVRASGRQGAFLAAAEAFVRCADETTGTQKTDFYGDAAKCYASADHHLDAAKFYIVADDYAGAAAQYRKAGRFDRIVQILAYHPGKLTESLKQELLYTCVVHYSRNNLRPPYPLFASTEAELKYLEEKGLHKARIDLLELRGRSREVAEVQLSLGRPCDGIQTLLRAELRGGLDAVQRAVDVALDAVWRACSFDMPVHDILCNKDSDAHKVLNLIKDIPPGRLNASDSRQIRFFLAVERSPHTETVYRLGEEFSDWGEDALALMAFDVCFSQLPALYSAHAAQIDNFLKRFERYVSLLVSIVSDETPLRPTDPHVRKVFGIVPSTDNHYTITEGAFLHRRFAHNRHLSAEIDLLLNDRLKARLRQKVLDQDNMISVTRALSTQCPYLVLHDQRCRKRDCGHQHWKRTSLNATMYNMKINLHLQQIRILDMLFSLEGKYEDWHARMTSWLNRLYSAIYCPIYVEGSVPDLNWNTFRDPATCVDVARKWIREAIEYLEPTRDPKDAMGYLMNVIRVTRLHTALGGECALQEYVSRESRHVSYGEYMSMVDDNVSADIVASIVDPDPIAGVSALFFLLQDGVDMDLAVVCDFAEEICGTLVSSLHPSGELCPLHDLVVPRRWIMNPGKPVLERDIIQSFLFCLELLMNILRSRRVSSAACSASVLGYNVRDMGLCKAIAEILLLPPPEVRDKRNLSLQDLRQLASLRRQYLETILALDSGAAIKDLVHLVHRNNRYLTLRISPRIPQLFFVDAADVSKQVKQSPPF